MAPALRRLLMVGWVAVAGATPTHALDDRHPLNGAEVQSTFDGKTIEGFYPSGVTFLDAYGPNGRVDYQEPGKAVSGAWDVRGEALCTFYTDGSGGCFFVVRTSPNCFEFYAALDHDAPRRERSDLDWTARAWLTDRPSTCQGMPSV
jgi:hypothetical protein